MNKGPSIPMPIVIAIVVVALVVVGVVMWRGTGGAGGGGGETKILTAKDFGGQGMPTAPAARPAQQNPASNAYGGAGVVAPTGP